MPGEGMLVTVNGKAAGDSGVDWTDVYEDYLDRIGPAPGVPSGDGAMSWERSTHVDPTACAW